jgi:hypothetical protein
MNGGGLVVCLAMIVGLLLLVVYQGITTFWPVPLVLVRTIDGNTYLGEVTRVDRYELGYQDAAVLSGPVQQKALELLNPRFREKLLRLQDGSGLAAELTGLDQFVERAILKAVSEAPQVREAPAVERNALGAALTGALAANTTARIADVAAQLADSDSRGLHGRHRVCTLDGLAGGRSRMAERARDPGDARRLDVRAGVARKHLGQPRPVVAQLRRIGRRQPPADPHGQLRVERRAFSLGER